MWEPNLKRQLKLANPVPWHPLLELICTHAEWPLIERRTHFSHLQERYAIAACNESRNMTNKLAACIQSFSSLYCSSCRHRNFRSLLVESYYVLPLLTNHRSTSTRHPGRLPLPNASTRKWARLLSCHPARHVKRKLMHHTRYVTKSRNIAVWSTDVVPINQSCARPYTHICYIKL